MTNNFSTELREVWHHSSAELLGRLDASGVPSGVPRCHTCHWVSSPVEASVDVLGGVFLPDRSDLLMDFKVHFAGFVVNINRLSGYIEVIVM